MGTKMKGCENQCQRRAKVGYDLRNEPRVDWPVGSIGDLQNGCYVQSGATTKIKKGKNLNFSG